MTGRRVSAIVLAGGRSSRFGRDKLVELLDGRPLLEHAIGAVEPFATEILVVVAPDRSPAVPRDVRVIRDPAPYEGPLVGLAAGLDQAREATVLVTAGDMPGLRAAIIELLLARLAQRGVQASILEHAGRPQPLPMALSRGPATQAVARLIASGERRLRALPAALHTVEVHEATWRALDPDGTSLHDVDAPDDLP